VYDFAGIFHTTRVLLQPPDPATVAADVVAIALLSQGSACGSLKSYDEALDASSSALEL
jgi:hypothetical protein